VPTVRRSLLRWTAPGDALISIRSLQAHEVGLHREVRVRALRESPDSFGETAAEAEAQPHSYWYDLTRSVTAPDQHIMFLAYDGTSICGSTYGLLDRERSDAARVGGMWVDPSWRRQGVGRCLLQAVVSWARQRRFNRLVLWTPAANAGAIALYRGAGFVDTGRQRPLRPGTELRIIEMECAL
jgi:GNAT superfamily N-acetyltransferase